MIHNVKEIFVGRNSSVIRKDTMNEDLGQVPLDTIFSGDNTDMLNV